MNFQEIYNEACAAAQVAAQEWLTNAEAAGDKWKVMNGTQEVGRMLDLCGNAYIQLRDKRTAFARWAAVNCVAHYESLDLPYPLRSRQEHGLHIAAMRAALKVLTEAGIEKLAFRSYID